MGTTSGGPVDRQQQAVQAAHRHTQEAGRAILEEFVEFLGLPNVSADIADVERVARHIVTMLELGASPELATAIASALDGRPAQIKPFRASLGEPGKYVSLSFWRDEAAVRAWRVKAGAVGQSRSVSSRIWRT